MSPATDTPKRPARSAAANRDAYLCFCEEVTAEAFRDHIRAHQDQPFEDACAALGVASKCTACLLNAENEFVEAARGSAKPGETGKHRAPQTGHDRPTGRHRIYALLDAVSPSLARRIPGIIPIIAGPGIKTTLAFSNVAPPLIGERAPAFDISIETHDSEGRLVDRVRDRVERNSRREFEVSKGISGGAVDGISTGACFLTYRAHGGSGYLGCIRPHFKVESAISVSSVHSAAGGARHAYIEARPANPAERQYVSVVNAATRPASVKVTTLVDGAPVGTGTWAVPARGARLCAVPAGAPLDAVVGVAAEADRPVRWHFMVAEGTPPRLSLDHI